MRRLGNPVGFDQPGHTPIAMIARIHALWNRRDKPKRSQWAVIRVGLLFFGFVQRWLSGVFEQF